VQIYNQPDRTKAGYNPNEEHAIMSGGTPFATRDDLNIITQTNGEYSSHPFVLVDFKAPDGRPAMATFVLLPGAGSDSWYWHLVTPRLEALGHETPPSSPLTPGRSGLFTVNQRSPFHFSISVRDWSETS
jgi:hypothetical protein